MANNPEVTSKGKTSPDVQEVVESTKSRVSALKEEVATTSWVKSELNTDFREFFERLKSARWEFKEGNISKAIAILFSGEEQQGAETQHTENPVSTWTESSASTSTETSWSETQEKEPLSTEIVSIKNYIKDIKFDLKYATADNSFWLKIYPDGESNLKLQYRAVKKLEKVQESLKKQGYQLKIWDAYRPADAQFKLRDNYKWPAATKRSNVAEPKRKNWKKVGTSYHWTWKAVDLTLTDLNGNEVEMPTGFDDFSWKAKWESVNKLPKNDPKRKNAYILRDAMEQAWFYTIKSEWWHYQIDPPKEKAPRA